MHAWTAKARGFWYTIRHDFNLAKP